STKAPRLVNFCDAGVVARSCAAVNAAWRASALSASCLTERRTSRAATTSVTATAATTATPIAANSRARSDLTVRRGSRSGLHRLVARAPHRPDQVRTAELPPQLGDVHVDGACSAGVVEPPDPFQQQIA